VCSSSDELFLGERVSLEYKGERVKGYIVSKIAFFKDAVKVRDRDGVTFLAKEHLELAKWMSERFHSSLGKVLDLFFPDGLDDYIREMVVSQSPLLDFGEMVVEDFLKEYGAEMLNQYLKRGLVTLRKQFFFRTPKPRLKKRVFLREGSMRFEKSLTLKQRMVVDYLCFNNGSLVEEILEELGITQSVLEALQQKGIVEIREEDVIPKVFERREKREIELDKRNLFFGPTGSGKTETLFEVIGDYLEKGQILLLVPEVSVLMHTVARLKGLYPELKVAIYHSYLTKTRKVLEWYRVVSGEANVLIGTRSALFVPAKKLKLILVDEEHDESFYQFSEPSYDAVEVAKKLATLLDVSIILSSASPSLTTYFEARDGKIKLFKFEKKWADTTFEIVDMRKEERTGSFARRTLFEIEETVRRGKKVLIFVRRKGFWGRVQCETCGYVLLCPNCDVALSYHFDTDTFKCHQCGFEEEVFDICPKCGGILKGHGTGTEKVERELMSYLPGVRVKRIDREVVEDPMEVEDYVDDLLRGKIDVLVGTKMITKGFNIPEIGLVCVLDVDALLFVPDFSATLRTFQLLLQVFGRTSRSFPGKAILQTFHPEERVYKKLIEGDVEGFYEEELERRKILGYPPFRDLVHVAIRTRDSAFGRQIIQKIADSLSGRYEILGPVEHHLFKLKGEYRYHFIAKVEKAEEFLRDLKEIERVLGIETTAYVNPPSLDLPS